MDEKNIPIYRERILFGLTRKLNEIKYILWINSIPLSESSCYIH